GLRTEARFLDKDGDTIEAAPISGLEMLPEYGIVGYLQASDQGLYAGLDVEGQLVVLDKSGGRRQPIGGIVPVGVHRGDGKLYLVGEAGGGPAIAAIDNDGELGKLRTWDASLEAVKELGNEIDVIDDRNLPSTEASWAGPRTA